MASLGRHVLVALVGHAPGSPVLDNRSSKMYMLGRATYPVPLESECPVVVAMAQPGFLCLSSPAHSRSHRSDCSSAQWRVETSRTDSQSIRVLTRSDCIYESIEQHSTPKNQRHQPTTHSGLVSSDESPSGHPFPPSSAFGWRLRELPAVRRRHPSLNMAPAGESVGLAASAMPGAESRPTPASSTCYPQT